ncbi:MAG: substrate-binding domain-containing protein, partial [Vallitaleaceae bacterium]|nr:substrate-binding domain-containing protein [Vallitaleaceae bacterium]
GFIEGLEKYPNIHILDETWDCNSDVDLAYKKTLEILVKYPDVTGIFGSNEVSILGVARAIKDSELTGKIKLIGFDSNEEVVKLIEEGVIEATMVQRPFNMGYMGVKKAIEEYYNKKNVSEFIDTGYVVITKDNIYEPENQKLIFPFKK